jgi:hypothetical protein
MFNEKSEIKVKKFKSTMASLEYSFGSVNVVFLLRTAVDRYLI